MDSVSSSFRDTIPVHSVPQHRQQQTQSRLPTWLKIVLILIIILLVYLIVCNMEPAYSPPAIDTSI